jgi:hypothetical protein
MADKKISALTGASTPLAGTEVLPIVQSGATVKVAVSDLTAGRTVNAASLITTGNAGVGVTPSAWGTSGAVFKTIEYGTVGNAVAGFGAGSSMDVMANAYYNSGWIYANTGTTALRASLNGDVAGAFTWNVAPAGTAGGAISFTQAMKLDNSANLTVDAGNVIIGTSGKGIDFSATSHPAGMTSELLADYEEGTWTPTVAGDGTAGTASYSNQVARYTKIGSRVFFACRLVWTGGTGTGAIRVNGLPYTSASITDNFLDACSIIPSDIGLTALNYIVAYVFTNTAFISIEQAPVGGGATSSVTYDAAGSLNISGSYLV